VLSGFFLGAYVGLSVPVVGLGIATQYVPAREVMLVFVAIVIAALVASLRAVIGANTAGSVAERHAAVAGSHDVTAEASSN
jgi:hypothetical protein